MSMQPIKFLVELFPESEKGTDGKDSRDKLLWLLEALTRIDQVYLRSHPDTPRLYDSGVIYQPEFGTEDWQDIPTTKKRGWGDCEDLAAWACAERREYDNIPAKPHLRWQLHNGVYRFHALVLLPDMNIEDPSMRLGMGKWREYLANS